MAESRTIMASALWLMVIASFAFAQHVLGSFVVDPNEPKTFKVRGRVICDTCKVGNETRVSYNMEKAEVKMMCFKSKNPQDKSAYIEGVFTNSDGEYTFYPDKKDYGIDDCQVHLVKSRDPQCKIISPHMGKARFNLALNKTFHSRTRSPATLAFEVVKPRPDCPQAVAELAKMDTRDFMSYDELYVK